MGFLTEWIMNIIVFILLAIIVDMLLPNSNMKKYTKMVVGLLLIAIILTPLLKVVTKDFDSIISSFTDKTFVDKAQIENSIEMKKREIQASQDAYTLDYMEDQMKKDVEEELIDRFGKSIRDIDISIKENEEVSKDQIDKVTVYLEDAQSEKVVTVVEPVDINTDKPNQKENSLETTSIISTLSNRWDLPTQQVELHIEGGDS